MAKSKLSTLRKNAGLTQQDLADAIGAHWTTISRLENGKLDLTYEWADKIARVLKVAWYDVGGFERVTFRAFVRNGLKENGTRGSLYEQNNNNFIDLPMPAPDGWEMVEDDSFFPMLQKGDLLRLESWDPADAEKLLGHMCVIVGFTGDPPEYSDYLGILARGKKAGTFCVRLLTRPDSPDFERLTLIGKVETIYPKPVIPQTFKPIQSTEEFPPFPAD